MPKASDLKKGSVIEHDGEVYIARQIEKRNPSARGASTLFKVRFFNVRNGQKMEQTLKGDDFLKDGDLTKRAVQFSYREDEMITFMDSEDFSQYTLNADTLEEQSGYMTEDLEGMIAMLVDGQVVGIERARSAVEEGDGQRRKRGDVDVGVSDMRPLRRDRRLGAGIFQVVLDVALRRESKARRSAGVR